MSKRVAFTKLAPCPFCGGNGAVMQAFSGKWQASCTECHCGTPERFEKPELAVLQWNKRRPSLLEALEGLIDAVRRDANDGTFKGISGYTSARLHDAREAAAEAREVANGDGF